MSLDQNVIASTVIMSRRKNGTRKAWKKKLTEISNLTKKLKKNPENDSLRMKLKSLKQKVVMPKSLMNK